jgi:hypothetical protein
VAQGGDLDAVPLRELEDGFAGKAFYDIAVEYDIESSVSHFQKN